MKPQHWYESTRVTWFLPPVEHSHWQCFICLGRKIMWWIVDFVNVYALYRMKDVVEPALRSLVISEIQRVWKFTSIRFLVRINNFTCIHFDAKRSFYDIRISFSLQWLVWMFYREKIRSYLKKNKFRLLHWCILCQERRTNCFSTIIQK